jgi:hypothetical protein
MPARLGAERGEENVMRWSISTIGAVALAAVMLIEPAAAARSKMGCEIGSEIWDVSQGKCVPGTYTKKSAKKVKKGS